jgi:hypothetical protein
MATDSHARYTNVQVGKIHQIAASRTFEEDDVGSSSSYYDTSSDGSEEGNDGDDDKLLSLTSLRGKTPLSHHSAPARMRRLGNRDKLASAQTFGGNSLSANSQKLTKVLEQSALNINGENFAERAAKLVNSMGQASSSTLGSPSLGSGSGKRSAGNPPKRPSVRNPPTLSPVRPALSTKSAEGTKFSPAVATPPQAAHRTLQSPRHIKLVNKSSSHSSGGSGGSGGSGVHRAKKPSHTGSRETDPRIPICEWLEAISLTEQLAVKMDALGLAQVKQARNFIKVIL